VHLGMAVKKEAKPRRRSRSSKIGRIKYNQQLLKRALREIDDIKLMQRTIVKGLEGMFHFEKPFIQKTVCKDEVDEWILDLLYQAGEGGVLPKDLSLRLLKFKVNRHKVSRRIKRMNKRLRKEIGQSVAEKRGWHWALTSFCFGVWGEAEKELLEFQ